MNQSAGEFYPEQRIDTSTVLSPYNNYFDIKTVGASFAYQFKNNMAIRARTAYDNRDFSARYFYTSSTFDKSVEKVASWWNHFQLSKTSGLHKTDLNIAFKLNTDEFEFSPDFPSINEHTTRLLNFTLNHLQYLNETITLKMGIQVDHRQIESNDRGDHRDTHYGLYGTGIYRNQNLNVSLSLRGDYDDNYEFEFSPLMNFSYVLQQVVIRGSLGRSIRAADYTERYVSNNLENLTPGRSLGNPSLLAERAWSEEIGIDYFISKNWQFSGTIFSRQSTNLVDFVSTNQNEIGTISSLGSLQENENYFFAKNIAQVSTNGFEAEISYNQTLSKDIKMQWNLGYTLLNTSNEDDVISVYLSSHAKHLITTRLLFSWKRFDWAISGLYKERNGSIASSINSELEKSYSVWNTRIGLKLSKNFVLNFQIQNAFDKSYQNILGANMPGRWILGGVKWNL